jgi:low temperature requirement protein LtrA
MQAGNVLKRLRLRSIENRDRERHASWLELFFDLIFVLAVAQIAQALNHDLTLTGCVHYLVLFAPVWWAWVGYSFYADRFESDEVIFRLMMFAGMLAMAAVAVNVHGAFQGGERAFTFSYVAVRVILIAFYIRAAYYVPLARDLCVRYAIGFGIGSLVWLASAFVPNPMRYGFWAVGFLIELATPFVNMHVARRTPYDSSHVPERFGLFTLIVIGEASLTAINGLVSMDWQLRAAVIAACGFAITAAIWWSYYEFVEVDGISENRRAGGQIYMYSHFPISIGIAAIGVSIQHAVVMSSASALSPMLRWTLCGSVALYLLAISAIRLSLGRWHLVWARLVAVFIILLMALLGDYLPPLGLIVLLLVTLIGEIWAETYYKEKSKDVSPVESSPPTARCSHADQIRDVEPQTNGCQECLEGHYQWEHLRMCLVCGHVGCCDSSKYKHATKHFQVTGHQIIKSLEPGEDWSWCYVDETYI